MEETGKTLTLYDSGDYADVDEFMERHRDDFGEDLRREQAWRLLSEQRREDLAYVVEDADRLISREAPGGLLMARGTQSRWDGSSSGFSNPYGSFASLVGDTGGCGLFRDCTDFKVYVEGGGLFVDGRHHDGLVSVEVRALPREQAQRFGGVADSFLNGNPAPMRRLWDRASRIDVRQGGLALVVPDAGRAAQGSFERDLAAAAPRRAGAALPPRSL